MAFGNTVEGHRVQLTVKGLSGSSIGPFNFVAAAGSCMAISGLSGVGKSLLLRMIADLDPNEGEVFLGGSPRSGMAAAEWRRQVMYVAAETGWWADTVAEHLDDLDAVKLLLPQLGLEESVFAASPSRLSTGQRQRLALVRAIVKKPSFLLLDEPTASLDMETTLLVEGVLGYLRGEGMGLIVVSHSPEQVRRLAHRHFMMSRSGLQEVIL